MQAKQIRVSYVQSDTKKIQGTQQDIEPYTRRGYDVLRNDNGNWILTRSSKVHVTIETEDGTIQVFNMKLEILRFYNRIRISENIVEQFKSDFENGRIEILVNGNYGALIKSKSRIQWHLQNKVHNVL